jgi:hypothetical protein
LEQSVFVGTDSALLHVLEVLAVRLKLLQLLESRRVQVLKALIVSGESEAE